MPRETSQRQATRRKMPALRKSGMSWQAEARSSTGEPRRLLKEMVSSMAAMRTARTVRLERVVRVRMKARWEVLCVLEMGGWDEGG